MYEEYFFRNQKLVYEMVYICQFYCVVLLSLVFVFVEFDLSGDNKLLKLRTLKFCWLILFNGIFSTLKSAGFD